MLTNLALESCKWSYSISCQCARRLSVSSVSLGNRPQIQEQLTNEEIISNSIADKATLCRVKAERSRPTGKKLLEDGGDSQPGSTYGLVLSPGFPTDSRFSCPSFTIMFIFVNVTCVVFCIRGLTLK